MTDATIYPIRPAEQSVLADAPPPEPAITTTFTGQCTGFRVAAADPIAQTVELEIITRRGRRNEILSGLPREVIAKLVAAFADGETQTGSE